MITLVDTSLRDGMSSVSHRFTPEQVGAAAKGLDRAGIQVIEVAHGIGIGASSIQYGFAAATDVEYVQAAVGAVDRADIAVLYVPGISTLAALDAVRDAGATTVRVATHCTEADCAEQPIRHARDHGMRVMSFLMMSHKLEPAALAEQAAKLDSYGAQVIYVVDSAGALVPGSAGARVAALRDAVHADIGFHAHNNLGVGIGNALAAVENGATYIDGSLRGLGASAGERPDGGSRSGARTSRSPPGSRRLRTDRGRRTRHRAVDDRTSDHRRDRAPSRLRRSLLHLLPPGEARRGQVRRARARNPPGAGPTRGHRRPGGHDHRRHGGAFEPSTERVSDEACRDS